MLGRCHGWERGLSWAAAGAAAQLAEEAAAGQGRAAGPAAAGAAGRGRARQRLHLPAGALRPAAHELWHPSSLVAGAAGLQGGAAAAVRRLNSRASMPAPRRPALRHPGLLFISGKVGSCGGEVCQSGSISAYAPHVRSSLPPGQRGCAAAARLSARVRRAAGEHGGDRVRGGGLAPAPQPPRGAGPRHVPLPGAPARRPRRQPRAAPALPPHPHQARPCAPAWLARAVPCRLLSKPWSPADACLKLPPVVEALTAVPCACQQNRLKCAAASPGCQPLRRSSRRPRR